MVEWALELDGMERVGSLNAVVGETNDGGLNDIRSRPITAAHVREALETASSGPVAEGSVGAGRGTRAFGWKGGIGTSSRILPESLGGFTVGVLVQSNFGGILTIAGAPVGKELGRYSFQRDVATGEPDLDALGPPDWTDADEGQGSIMMVVATDAPLSPLKLERLAKRAVMGLARTGSFAGNGSGDYVIAFSTAPELRSKDDSDDLTEGAAVMRHEDLSPLFQATIEATEEAIFNSLLKAVDVVGKNGNRRDALPIDRVLEIKKKYNRE